MSDTRTFWRQQCRKCKSTELKRVGNTMRCVICDASWNLTPIRNAIHNEAQYRQKLKGKVISKYYGKKFAKWLLDRELTSDDIAKAMNTNVQVINHFINQNSCIPRVNYLKMIGVGLNIIRNRSVVKCQK